MTRYILILMIIFFVIMPIFAQDNADACPNLVEEALTLVGEACGDLSRNVACYGHGDIEAQTIEEIPLEDFSNQGDMRPIQDIYTLTTAPMDVEQNIWGVAVLALQANLPDTIPGQNVTFLLYGDAQMTSEVDTESGDGDAPFQAFRYTSGIGEPQCTEAPHDGLLVQSPEGVTVNFMINGIEVELGSTVLIQGDNTATSFTNIEGNVTVTADGVSQTLAVGKTVSVDTPDGIPQEPPSPTNFDMVAVQSVPINALPQEITLPSPAGAKFFFGYCNNFDEVNIEAGQPVTWNINWTYTDAATLARATHTFVLEGTNVPLWSTKTLSQTSSGIEIDYVYVTEPLEVGTYEAIYTGLGFEFVCNIVVR